MHDVVTLLAGYTFDVVHFVRASHGHWSIYRGNPHLWRAIFIPWLAKGQTLAKVHAAALCLIKHAPETGMWLPSMAAGKLCRGVPVSFERPLTRSVTRRLSDGDPSLNKDRVDATVLSPSKKYLAVMQHCKLRNPRLILVDGKGTHVGTQAMDPGRVSFFDDSTILVARDVRGKTRLITLHVPALTVKAEWMIDDWISSIVTSPTLCACSGLLGLYVYTDHGVALFTLQRASLMTFFGGYFYTADSSTLHVLDHATGQPMRTVNMPNRIISLQTDGGKKLAVVTTDAICIMNASDQIMKTVAVSFAHTVEFAGPVMYFGEGYSGTMRCVRDI